MVKQITDMETWLLDNGDRLFRYRVYRRMFTPYEQEKKYMDQSDFESDYHQFGYIEEAIDLGNGEWYLWPGWCIFNFAKFTARPNFEPIFTQKSFLDTGGSNYPRYYNRYDIQAIPFPLVKSLRYKKTEGLNRHCDILHSDYIQIVDESWLHIINGSNYAKIPGKEDMISRVLSDTAQFWDTIKTTANTNISTNKGDLFVTNNEA